MTRSADEFKRQAWRRRLRQFYECNLTVAAFCRQEGVSVPSFYHWRKILGSAELPATGSAYPSRGFARPPSVNRGTFVPVEIVSVATIEMHLPNGVRLAIPAGDLAALEAAVTAAGRLSPTATVEGESC